MKKYKWLNKDSRDFLKRGYLQTGESAEQRGHDIAVAAEKLLKVKGFSDKFEEYLSKGFYSLSSPIWANFGRERGLPISCNGVFIEDRMDAILEKQAEVGMQTKHGAGTSAYFGGLRSRGAEISAGGTSSGPVHFMELFDKVSSVVSQSNVRRGSFAAYLPVDHPDINEFLRIRGEGNPIQEMSFGVCITDEWMRSMIEGDRKKRSIWASIIRKRFETGYPYLFFTDTANKAAPKAYKDKKLKISASNLCSEIFLNSSQEESFVCCLSSLNLLKWDEIVETDAVETLVYFLDAVMEEYIHKTENRGEKR
jgi:ribonucleoside-diphosphate reductase alpha chain